MILEIILALLYYFKEGFGNLVIGGFFLSGNADLFYILAIYYVVIFFKQSNKEKIQFILWIVPLVLFGLLQFFLIEDLSFKKMAVNIIKIGVCVAIMFVTKKKMNKVNFERFLVAISALFLISIPLSFVFRSSFLWRTNDEVNKYAMTRLQLFYMEPSELGFQLALIIIILISLMVYSKNSKKVKVLGYCLIVNLAVLLLAKPMGAIVILTMSVSFMFLIYIIINPSKQSLIIAGSALAIVLAVIVIGYVTKNSIYMRVVDTINGADASNQYRILVATDVTEAMLKNSNGLGIGLGNLNRFETRLIYWVYGLYRVIPNSFLYVIGEAGIFAIGLILVIVGMLTIKCIKDKSIMKWGLLFFVVVYQIFGGHFTNPMNWIIYGLILSDINERNIVT